MHHNLMNSWWLIVSDTNFLWRFFNKVFGLINHIGICPTVNNLININKLTVQGPLRSFCALLICKEQFLSSPINLADLSAMQSGFLASTAHETPWGVVHLHSENLQRNLSKYLTFFNLKNAKLTEFHHQNDTKSLHLHLPWQSHFVNTNPLSHLKTAPHQHWSKIGKTLNKSCLIA